MRLKKLALIVLVIVGLTLAVAAPAYAEDTPDSVADAATSGGQDEATWEYVVAVPVEKEGEAPNACVQYLLHHWDNYWWFGSNSWHHRFNPVFCRNGTNITYRDLSNHYQTCNGFYNCNGVSRFVSGGCVGCSFIQAKGIAQFNWSWGGVTRNFTRCWNIRVNGNGSWSHWLGC